MLCIAALIVAATSSPYPSFRRTRAAFCPPSEELHTRAVAMAKGLAITEVKFLLKQAGEDFERGHLRVTEDMDSNLEREYVIAEWFAVE